MINRKEDSGRQKIGLESVRITLKERQRLPKDRTRLRERQTERGAVEDRKKTE